MRTLLAAALFLAFAAGCATPDSASSTESALTEPAPVCVGLQVTIDNATAGDRLRAAAYEAFPGRVTESGRELHLAGGFDLVTREVNERDGVLVVRGPAESQPGPSHDGLTDYRIVVDGEGDFDEGVPADAAALAQTLFDAMNAPIVVDNSQDDGINWANKTSSNGAIICSHKYYGANVEQDFGYSCTFDVGALDPWDARFRAVDTCP